MSDLAVAAGRLAPGQTAFRVLVVDDDPDLVLLDVLMPGIDGFEICERLKADPASAMIPIVLVTALEDQESRLRGIRAGADDFLSKPVRREELIARVKTLRRLHTTRRELEARHLGAEVQRKEALRRAFSRYISPRLADRIISELDEDGAPFRRGAQRVSVVALLGFNVPFPQPDAAARAWRTAHDMLASFAAVLARWTASGGAPTGLGIGIASGEAILGNIGDSGVGRGVRVGARHGAGRRGAGATRHGAARQGRGNLDLLDQALADAGSAHR